MKRSIVFLLLFVLAIDCGIAAAADQSLAGLLSPDLCGEQWVREGKVLSFGRDNLFDRINGEAELYFPYGFRALVTATYINRKDPDSAIVVDLYEMGSRLDAFGIYSNYRRTDDSPVNQAAPAGAKIGTEGFISPSQLMFYQGDLFVRIQATGSGDLYRAAFRKCGETLTRALPPAPERPAVLNALAVPGIVSGSERYIAQSLLGYEFFRRGLTADAGPGWMQVFCVLAESPEDARNAFERYHSYLKESGGKGIRVTDKAGQPSLSAVDPLYGSVSVLQSGPFLIGAVKIKNPSKASRILQSVRSKLSLNR